VGEKECEMTLMCRVAQKRKVQLATDNPLWTVHEKIETEPTVDAEYVVMTLRENGEERGFEFVEGVATSITEAKARRSADILRRGLHLGITVPKQSSNHLRLLRDLFLNMDLEKDFSRFVYDEEGDIERA
jgi:hypothetical protein